MRALALAAIAVSVLVAAYFIALGPRPAPAAQVAARAAADSITRARLAAFERGDLGGWASALRPDALLIADAAEPQVGPTAASAAMERSLAARAVGGTLAVPPRRVTVGATRRGRLAWAATVDDRGHSGEDSLGAPRLHSVAYLLQDGEWRVVLEHDARGSTWEALRAEAAARRIPAPAALGAPQGRRAEEMARALTRRLDHLGRIRVERDAIAVGPTAGEVASGDSAVKVMLADWERRLGALRLAPRGLAAWAPRNRGVGWVAANLEASPPGWGGATLPLRFTGVYRPSGEDSWRLVLAHLSVGMSEPAAGASPAAAASR